MNDNVEVLNSVGLDDMTQKAIKLVANEIEEKIRGNLQRALHEAAVKELSEVKFNVQMIENKIAEVGKRLLAEHNTRIDEVISKQDEVATKQLNDSEVIKSTLAEVEKHLLSEYRTRIDKVIAKQDEVVAKHQDVRELIESTFAEVEKRLLSEQRTRIDEVEGKLVRTQQALLGLMVVTLLATITGIFL